MTSFAPRTNAERDRPCATMSFPSTLPSVCSSPFERVGDMNAGPCVIGFVLCLVCMACACVCGKRINRVTLFFLFVFPSRSHVRSMAAFLYGKPMEKAFYVFFLFPFLTRTIGGHSRGAAEGIGWRTLSCSLVSHAGAPVCS